MRLAPEGWPFVLGSLALTGLLAAGAWLGPSWAAAPAILSAALSAFVAYFFRDPVRVSAALGDIVVAAGEGKIIEDVQVDEATFMEGPCRRVSIFLSVFNVHVQRAPCSADVSFRSYHRGGYAVAWHPKASDENERASLGFVRPEGRILVKQIAGLIARRIVTDPVEGDRVERSQRIGLIRFGSRVDMFVPLHWEVLAQVGDRVRTGSTPMFRMTHSPAGPQDDR